MKFAWIAVAMLVVGFSGCLEEKAATTKTVGNAAPAVANVTAALPIEYSGNVGNRICVTSPTMCQPGGGGGPGGGAGMLVMASQNPHTEVVNGTPQSLTLKVTWTAAPPAGNSQFEVVVSAMAGASGGGGGGGAPRDIVRKSGTSPLTIESMDLKWASGEGRLRVMLYAPNRAPGGAPYLGVVAGQAFTVTGTYTTVQAPPAAPAAKAL